MLLLIDKKLKGKLGMCKTEQVKIGTKMSGAKALNFGYGTIG